MFAAVPVHGYVGDPVPRDDEERSVYYMGGCLQVMKLGRRPYRPVVRLQERLVRRRQAGEVPDTLILVEHEPVYTLGRNAEKAHVLLSEKELAKHGVDVVETTRGGDVTFHGPGQLVCYPIIDLAGRGGKVVGYVAQLEETAIRLLAEFGLEGRRDPEHRGVWIGGEKIAAVGIRISRGVTWHGLALNVCVNLEWYRGIVPCGISERGVTSLDRMVRNVSMERVSCMMVRTFGKIFGYRDVVAVAAPGEPCEDGDCGSTETGTEAGLA